MSSGNGMSIWVSDIDRYVSIDSINLSNAREQEDALIEAEWDDIGDVPLIGEHAIPAYSFSRRGVAPSEWRWAIHQAEQTIGSVEKWPDVQPLLVRALTDLGKSYAILRYSKFEHISHSSALAATLPFGFKAVLNQFFVHHGLKLDAVQRERISATLILAETTPTITAYQHVTNLQSIIHDIAETTFGTGGKRQIVKEAMRQMLSLARLRFSICELNQRTFQDVEAIRLNYLAVQSNLLRPGAHSPTVLGRYITKWQIRHLVPLTYFFPFCIRLALARGAQQHVGQVDRDVAVNELALAHCGMMLMRRSKINRRASSL